MTSETFEKMLLAKQAYRAAAGNEDQRHEAYPGYLQAAIDRISMAHDFNWSTRRHEVTGGSVADEDVYACPGEEGNDAGYISSVLYGDLPSLKRLEIKQHDEIDRMIGDGYGFNGVEFWLDEMGAQPQVRLVATPTEAGKTIRYVYRKKGVDIAAFPDFHVAELLDVFMWVFADSFKTDSGIIISTNYEKKGKEAIARMIAATDKGRAGRRPTPLGTEVLNSNIRRNRLHGYGR